MTVYNYYTRYKLIFLVLLTVIYLPFFFFFTLMASTYHSVIGGWIDLLFVVSYIYWIFMTGAWSWVGYYLRWLILILCVPIVIHVLTSLTSLPLWNGFSFDIAINLTLLIIFTFFIFQTWKGKKEPAKTLVLDFPFKNGKYIIGQGGSSAIVNRHYHHASQRYAMDIVKLNKWGFRARSIYPAKKEDYFIWNDPVYSPCDGTITKVDYGYKDFDPPQMDKKNPAGNHIAIQFAEGTLYLAHLRDKGIAVKEGDKIFKGDLIGYIGNSGNTTEPHLHIHAESGSSGESINNQAGLPIKFGEHFLKRNDILKYRVV